MFAGRIRSERIVANNVVSWVETVQNCHCLTCAGVFAITSMMAGRVVQRYVLTGSESDVIPSLPGNLSLLRTYNADEADDVHTHLELRITILVALCVTVGIWQVRNTLACDWELVVISSVLDCDGVLGTRVLDSLFVRPDGQRVSGHLYCRLTMKAHFTASRRERQFTFLPAS